ncbi:kinase-like domain-containing protein [Syncephalastrum racemosum]|uniref:non-specific serine/threonine protein kinase n=1 Tax=Syncephalastrum racemosum TaxID=13706 RepID=A0A1X2HBJ2_SYNRA|nr:kinase-like domain-containing protein [Syncephalastrum racemosum]
MTGKQLAAGTRINKYEIKHVLGLGAYGRVYLARDVKSSTKQYYAIKSLPQKKPYVTDHQRALQRAELTLHARLNHPNVIRLEHIVQQDDFIHVVLEHGPQGDLFSAITERKRYFGNHNLIRRVFLQLIDAVEHCHSRQVYHRDLKPENILVFDDGYTLKLADFGLATSDTVSREYGCGSTFYFSPECQGAQKKANATGYATAPNDIWSLGIILINLAAGRNPWLQACLDDESFRSYLADRDYIYKILPVSRELNTILKRILCIDPSRRINLQELREAIQQCKYFTRTREIERAENKPRLSLQNMFPPSPPTTPNEESSSNRPFFTPASPVSSRTSTIMKQSLQPKQQQQLPWTPPASPTSEDLPPV